MSPNPAKSPENCIYVGGSWRPAHATARLDVINPATELLIGQVVDADAVDVDTAVRAARDALKSTAWEHTTAQDRARMLHALASELTARASVMARTITCENGSPIAETSGAAPHAADFLRYTATLADSLDADVRRFPAGGATTSVRRVPAGVAALIAPWNFPLTLVMAKLAPALLAGCTVVVKPAPETPFHLAVLVEAIEAAHLPPGVVNVVTGGAGTGQLLVAHPNVDKIAFTGSTEAGRAIARECGALLRPVTLELGGKSAAVVLHDADLDVFAAQLIRSCLRNTGQTCYAATRILAPRSSYSDVLDIVIETVRSAPLGDPFDPTTVFGPLVSARQRDRVEKYIRLGTAEGARITTGGNRPSHLDIGYYVEPTVFADVDRGMRIAREEIFGPVLTVLAYSDEDEAISIANDSHYGLGGVVFSADDHRAAHFSQRLETGSVGINFFGSNQAAPFGGWKQSGLGVELGPEGLSAYVKYQSLHRRTSPVEEMEPYLSDQGPAS
ncbi:aldehyde dehydrogenase [Streptomyces bobili]|uniref:aldehyde dehydrogenase n=1 Tax=Streptomyces bobili TaxID=67280 RepID=UPI00382ABA49